MPYDIGQGLYETQSLYEISEECSSEITISFQFFDESGDEITNAPSFLFANQISNKLEVNTADANDAGQYHVTIHALVVSTEDGT